MDRRCPQALMWRLRSNCYQQLRPTMCLSPISKMSVASKAIVNLPTAIIVLSAFLAFTLVLFSDFMSTPLGGYADQRFLLIALSGLLVVCTIFSFAVTPLVSIRGALLVLLPVVILCAAFIALALPFWSQLYAWVEPGMYFFFFLAMVVSGGYLAWGNGGVIYSRALISIIAATCLIYGLTSVNVYLFAIFAG